ncbi:MAG: tRNA preQ1(34) S-adenosylmethionine ribosyltransferase-isomerase QueA [Planctomycetota bacterium]
MRTDFLDYDLPDELIATEPANPRDTARLMVIHRDTGRIEHRRVRDLPRLGVMRSGDLMVVNRTRVLPAYLVGTRVGTGGRVTGLFVRSLGPRRWEVLLESGGRLRPGDAVELTPQHDQVTETPRLDLVEPRGGGAWAVSVSSSDAPADLLARFGRTPLPPYIRRARRRLGGDEHRGDDPDRYNTVYAEDPGQAGSVAAPTAGLHFTPELLDALDHAGVRRAAVTLDVGLGTFQPVKTDTLEDHQLHRETIDVPPKTLDALRRVRDDNRGVWAVGTTTVRTLESLPDDLAGLARFAGETGLYITPDCVADGAFSFRHTDHLLTNFHLPRSTLLAMVAALPGVGVQRLLGWYREAVGQRYRFYSFGDAMLIV